MTKTFFEYRKTNYYAILSPLFIIIWCTHITAEPICKVGNAAIHVCQGDITKLSHMEAIVNAANESLLGGGGVDGAIHKAAGPKLLQHCKQIKEVSPGIRCPIGQARITPSFNLLQLEIKYIIHTVGPRGSTSQRKTLLKSTYHSCLILADKENIKSIAFPAISTGIYGYPLDEATQTAIDTVKKYLTEVEASSLTDVYFVPFDEKTEQEYLKLLKSTKKIAQHNELPASGTSTTIQKNHQKSNWKWYLLYKYWPTVSISALAICASIFIVHKFWHK